MCGTMLIRKNDPVRKDKIFKVYREAETGEMSQRHLCTFDWRITTNQRNGCFHSIKCE